MARYYVDANKVIEHIRQYKNSNKKTFQQGINFAIKVVCRALTDNRIVPRADVQEVKHGEWFLLDECANEGVYCSLCHQKVYKKDYANQKIKSKYCPNCGARMDGGTENDKL